MIKSSPTLRDSTAAGRCLPPSERPLWSEVSAVSLESPKRTVQTLLTNKPTRYWLKSGGGPAWQSRWEESPVQEGRDSSSVKSSSALALLSERPVFRRAANSGTARPWIPSHREAWAPRVGSSPGPLASGPVSMWHCVLVVLKCLKHSLPIESPELCMLGYVSDLRCRERFLNACLFPLLNSTQEITYDLCCLL